MASERFIVVARDDPRVPDYANYDQGAAIIDTKTDAFVGSDGGEPEDQLLWRDWAWVAPSLNAVDNELRAAESKLAAVRKLATSLLVEGQVTPRTWEETAVAEQLLAILDAKELGDDK